MIEHVSVPVRSYQTAKPFYEKTLAPLGYHVQFDYPGEATGFMEGGHTSFWITQKDRVEPTHVAFRADSKKAVEAFYAAALLSGGKDNGAPGFRTDYGPNYYAAFILDPDGNNIEACYFGEKAPGAA